ncbi:MAG: ATP-binding protein [Pseudomonadota bacterium]
MSFEPIYRGWDIPARIWLAMRQVFATGGLQRDIGVVEQRARLVVGKLKRAKVGSAAEIETLAESISESVLMELGADEDSVSELQLFSVLQDAISSIIEAEGWFTLPTSLNQHSPLTRSELWELEDAIKRTEQIVDDLDAVVGTLIAYASTLLRPVVDAEPNILMADVSDDHDLQFPAPLLRNLSNLPDYLDHLIQTSFAPELEQHSLLAGLQQRLEYNLTIASGGNPADAGTLRYTKLPSKAPAMSPEKLVESYLSGTPWPALFDISTTITIPQRTRTEHHHIVAGSGHGKTQTLQHFILHDLQAVERGEASVVVIDSQSDLIENIAGLKCFAPGQPLADRLIVIDPTDIEYPVALNLFDAGLDRLEDYSPLEREKLTNSILELYDFVLGSLLDAGMTQKQNVIFRYITRLLLHIPNATIHTLRELLEDGGYETYRTHMDELEGTARAFFDNEFMSKEFAATKKQVLRRLYGILENQTFERMFSHPKSKLDLFAEMNAGKVVLINTAKDLLKENGTQVFGRFFIALIAQAAQERATLAADDRLFTTVYVDEAQDYFDQNTAVILSQARKYNIGMVLAHQYLGQLDGKLQEAVFTNSSIKFAGGVSAKDARALASELRCDASFVESQSKLSFAAYVAGETKGAVSLAIEPGQMETLPRMSPEELVEHCNKMREQFAVHYSGLTAGVSEKKEKSDEFGKNIRNEDNYDDGSPERWE